MDNNQGNQEGQLYIVGNRGYSAYEIACQQGFVGTVDEWLASLKGDIGNPGPQGEPGIPGPVGVTPQLRAGTVETLNPGENAYANVIGTPEYPILKFGIPRGERGERGDTGLQGPEGPQGVQGKPFTVVKTYTSVAEMQADFNNMNEGDYVMIATSVEIEDNAKLYYRGAQQWLYISDFSGAQGIQGEQGPTGATGATGNGIVSVVKTSTSGLVDTYTITYDNGTTTTFEITNGEDGEDGEVTQAQLDETNIEVNKYKTIYNVLPKVENDTLSSEVELDGTGEAYMKVKPIGKVSQESTVGYQLLNLKNKTNIVYGITTNIVNGKVTISGINTNSNAHLLINQTNSLPSFEIGETYTIAKYKATSNIYMQFTYFNGSANKALGYMQNGKSTSFTIPDDYVSTNSFEIYCVANTVNLNVEFNLMLVKGEYSSENVPNYEPYTGGQPSPNPDYPQNIKVVTGNNNVKVENKNLFDEEFRQGSENNLTNLINIFSKNDLVLSAGTYTFSTNLPMSSYKYAIGTSSSAFPGNATFIAGFHTTSNFTFTLSEELHVGILINKNNNNIEPNDVENYHFMLEKGSTSGTYTPHKEQNYPLNIGNLEMYEGDCFFKNTTDDENYDSNLDLNAWYLKNYYDKVILDGSETWQKDANRNGDYDYFYLGNVFQWAYDFNKTKVDKFDKMSASEYDTRNGFIITNTTTTKLLLINISKNNTGITIENTQNERITIFKNWLSNNNTIVISPLATPTYTKITDTTLIGQLEAIDSADSYKEKTYITCTSASTDNEVLQVKAVALADLSDILGGE